MSLPSKSLEHNYKSASCWKKCNIFALFSWLIFFIGRRICTHEKLPHFQLPSHIHAHQTQHTYRHTKHACNLLQHTTISCSAQIFSHHNNSICVEVFFFYFSFVRSFNFSFKFSSLFVSSNGIWKPLHALQFNSYSMQSTRYLRFPFAFNKLQCTDFSASRSIY